MTVFDEPNLDSSAFPMLVISEAASKDVKVALSGDGGDELFGGYPKYISAHSLSWLSKTFTVPEPNFNFSSDRTRRYASILASATRGPVSLSNVLNEQYFYNWENPIGTPWIPRSDFENRLKMSGKARWLDLDLQGYLPGILQKVDLASMGSSLEVRSPFFNVELYELARSLRDHDLFSLRQTKSLLRSIAKKRLGSEVSSLPKSGFSPHRGKILDWAIREKGLVFGSGLSQIERTFNLKLPKNYSSKLMELRPASDRKIWALMVVEDWLSRR
jgi:asparagine synthase (glutamine-hydrolysing)